MKKTKEDVLLLAMYIVCSNCSEQNCKDCPVRKRRPKENKEGSENSGI